MDCFPPNISGALGRLAKKKGKEQSEERWKPEGSRGRHGEDPTEWRPPTPWPRRGTPDDAISPTRGTCQDLMAAEESFGKTRGTRIYRGDVLRLNLGPKHVRGRRRREAGRAEAGVQPRARELPLFRSLLHPWLCPPPLRSTIARCSQPRGSPKSRGELTAEKLEQDIDMG